METHFQVEFARSVVSVKNESLRRSLDVQSSLWKNSALFSSHIAKAFDVVCSSSKSPFVGTKKARKSRKVAGSKGAKKPAADPASGNGNINVD